MDENTTALAKPVKREMVEGVDLNSLCVLGHDILADHTALYSGADAIPFAERDGFKFILRQM